MGKHDVGKGISLTIRLACPTVLVSKKKINEEANEIAAITPGIDRRLCLRNDI